ncbi:hypothetical protein GCM10025868_02230 [Angustibacter aerolatus]|uniref:Uncharacterized protein n=1 Tax=Angustibacter aerolatus TaxID=1162965 RepID=A0ABQ6J9X6_9ACTN|nr:hypothetical protein GCM10025868_02230 [Angustibacter aerolatus]
MSGSRVAAHDAADRRTGRAAPVLPDVARLELAPGRVPQRGQHLAGARVVGHRVRVGTRSRSASGLAAG